MYREDIMEKEEIVYKEKQENKKELEKKKLDNKIYLEGRRVRLLEQLQGEFDDIGKSVNRCIELMSGAIEGGNSNALFEDLLNANRVGVSGINTMIESDTLNIKNHIEKIYEERDKLDEE